MPFKIKLLVSQSKITFYLILFDSALFTYLDSKILIVLIVNTFK